MTRLGDICKVISGSTPKTNTKEYWNGDIKWITPAELSEDSFYVFDSVRHISEEGMRKTGLKLFPVGTVILSSRAPIGKTAIAGIEMCCNQGFKNMICSDCIHNEYLYFFLKSKTDYLNSLGRGATFKEISKGIVEDIKIPLPTFEEQQRIAAMVKKVTKLLSLSKQQLTKLDELIKSRFIEMFGDPMSNHMGWEECLVGDVLKAKATNGFFAQNSIYADDGIAQVMWVGDIVNKTYSNTDNLRRINASSRDIEKYSVQYGDMLFCRSSLNKEGIGKSSIASKNVPQNTMFECHVIRTPLDLSKCIPEYMQILSITSFFRDQIITKSKTATMTTIGQDGILSTKIFLPPIELQKQFKIFLKQTENSKYEIQKSLDKLEMLKCALFQQYFS